jgi:pilus assembly protein CpaE
MATRVVLSSEYCSSKSDRSARRLIEAAPEIIIVEVREPAPALRSLHVLHSALPNTRLLIASTSTDPQLIIEAMHSGAREFLPLPASNAALLQAFNRHVAENERRTNQDQVKRGRLYCTISARRGSGATTVALNLAAIIAESTKSKVALLDLDRPVGDAAAYLGLKPPFTVNDAVSAAHRMDSTLLESYMTPSHGFHVLAGFQDHSHKNHVSAEALSQLLDVSVDTFQHTFVDLPECLDDEQAQVIAASSSVILVVVTPDVPSIWRTERLLTSLSRINAVNKVKVIVNRRSKSTDISEGDLERLLQHPIYCGLPNDYVSCVRAINSGRLLDASEAKHLVRALRELAVQVAGLPSTEPRRSLFGLFLKPSSIGGASNG